MNLARCRVTHRVVASASARSPREPRFLRVLSDYGLIRSPLKTKMWVKKMQRDGWVHFAPLEMLTMRTAIRLVKQAGKRSGQRVLDVSCGTGVVAVTAARLGAQVTGLDLTPELFERARG